VPLSPAPHAATVDLASGTVAHRVFGPSQGDPIVFVHGALVDGSLWHEVADRLDADGLRALAPDLPMGSHRTALPDADLTPTGQAALLLDYLDHLDLTGVTLVANDSGGAVTQLLLGSGDKRVERVSRVVFTNCDTVGRFPPPPFDRMFAAATRPRLTAVLLQPNRSAAVRASRLGFGPLCAEPLDPALTWRWIEPALTDAGIRRDFARFAAGVADQQQDLADATDRLHSFDGPVLVVWGTDDRFFRLADGRKLADRFPAGRVVEVPGSRTFVAHDRPERLAEEVAAFVGATVS